MTAETRGSLEPKDNFACCAKPGKASSVFLHSCWANRGHSCTEVMTHACGWGFDRELRRHTAVAAAAAAASETWLWAIQPVAGANVVLEATAAAVAAADAVGGGGNARTDCRRSGSGERRPGDSIRTGSPAIAAVPKLNALPTLAGGGGPPSRVACGWGLASLGTPEVCASPGCCGAPTRKKISCCFLP